jgi:hypothetical protein
METAGKLQGWAPFEGGTFRRFNLRRATVNKPALNVISKLSNQGSFRGELDTFEIESLSINLVGEPYILVKSGGSSPTNIRSRSVRICRNPSNEGSDLIHVKHFPMRSFSEALEL